MLATDQNRFTQNKRINEVKICPCCSDCLLRHVSGSEIYWFCPACRQKMPVLVVAPKIRSDKS